MAPRKDITGNRGYGNYQAAGRTTVRNSVTESTAQLQVNTIGHPGKWYKAYSVAANSEFEFTGSNYGAAGIILSGSHTDAGTIDFTGGGSIAFGSLVPQTLYEFSIKKVTIAAGTAAGGTAGGATVLFRKNQF